MSLFGIVGFSAVGLVVVAWLVISFMQPGPRRSVVEWLAACALYVSLISLFGSLVTRTLESGNTFGSVAFGFLLALFGIGLVLALVQLVRSLGGERKSESSATH